MNFAPINPSTLDPGVGRLNIAPDAGAANALAAKYTSSLPGFGFRTTGDTIAQTDMIRGNMEPNSVNQTFFSPANVQIIQNLIRATVYTKSGNKWIIDPVSTDELYIVMRGIYYQYGKNLETQVREQVEELNHLVSQWSVPRIMSEISMYQTYIKDATSMPIPMELPVNLSMSGTKSKPLEPFF